MKILITSGGTTEYIDNVRVLTNVSTGKLGAITAKKFLEAGFQVTYVAAKFAETPPTRDIGFSHDYPYPIQIIPVSDVASLMHVMEQEVPKHDVIIHAMAVSDYGFKHGDPVKLKSNSTKDFIEFLRERIYINPKVISYIKRWNPKCKLVGFKFEVGKSRDDLLDIAIESLKRNDCDLVVANDKAEMVAAKEHIAYIMEKDRAFTTCSGKEKIAEYLVKYAQSL